MQAETSSYNCLEEENVLNYLNLADHKAQKECAKMIKTEQSNPSHIILVKNIVSRTPRTSTLIPQPLTM